MSKAKEANDLMESGMTAVEAAKQIGIPVTTLYSYRSNRKQSGKKTRTYRRRKPAVIALPEVVPHVQGNAVFAFYGNPADVANLVRTLQ